MRGLLTLSKALALSLLSLLALSCDDRAIEIEATHPIPRLPVALRVSLDHEGRELRNPYSLMSYTQATYEGERLGHLGVVVVHTTAESYAAYDLACPYCWPDRVGTMPSTDSPKGLVVAECPHCKSCYDLALGVGHPISGPAQYPLLQYQVRHNHHTLWIY